jgi:hypothetical protein
MGVPTGRLGKDSYYKSESYCKKKTIPSQALATKSVVWRGVIFAHVVRDRSTRNKQWKAEDGET